MRALGGLAGMAVGLAVALAPTTAVAAVPLPDQDPFYAVPENIGGVPNGVILKTRQVSVSAYSIPLPARAWQVQYKSLDTHDRPTADVATVMVPTSPWTGNGKRPLLSYQTAEDGVGSKCSPSYALRAGLQAGSSNSEAETGLMQQALLRGWAVVAPDYEGPNSAFLGAAGEAHGVLDGIRAARALTPAGVGPGTPIGLWGYSGGALATDLAAQAQPSYAPELRFAGIALGGVVTDIRATLTAFSGSPFGGAIAMGLVGANRAYPEANLTQYLNAAGRQAVASAQADCINDAVSRFPFARIEQYEARPGVLDLPAVAALLHEMSPLSLPGTPSAPVYDYHAVLDELAPIGPDRAQMRRFCSAGATVQHVEDLASEHVTLAATGSLGALNYLAARFSAAPAPSNCGSIPAA